MQVRHFDGDVVQGMDKHTAHRPTAHGTGEETDAPPHTTSRWSRLERYARWKARRFPLARLPCDVLAHVLSYLTYADVNSVLAALHGRTPLVETRAQLERYIPVEIRSTWMHHAAVEELERQLVCLGDVALFYARDCPSVHAYADWSPFSPPPHPRPVAEYAWQHHATPRAPYAAVPSVRAQMRINRVALGALVDACLASGCCAVRVALFMSIATSGVLPCLARREFHATVVHFLPAGLLS